MSAIHISHTIILASIIDGEAQKGKSDMGDHNVKDKRQGDKHRQSTRKYGTLVAVEATCRICKKKFRARFVPRDPKAVLCDSCFEKEFGHPPPGSPPLLKNKLYNAVCSQCGAACQIPWKPTADSPAVCRDCRQGIRKTGESKLARSGAKSGGKIRLVQKKKAK
ncbi:MAG: hypothetical protein GXP49_03830 [Deltaproteobacteria bacterium]|nr:hypothetical protein [Deltaproteobacteria bacterium]